MTIIIRRGQNQIGGNIVEIATDTTKILFDIGCELHEGAERKCPQIRGLFDSAEYDAIFISHYHLDHMGLLEYIDKNIPIYMGEKSIQVLNAAAKYKNETPPRINTPKM